MSAALAIGMAAPASAGVNDPEIILYRVPAVVDSGDGPLTGVATVFSCTNFSGVNENIRFATRDSVGTLVSNLVFTTPHLTTRTFATHPVIAYSNAPLTTGQLTGGTTAIAATSINIICTAMAIDASAAVPTGVALRAIRFNPVPGSQE